jgi:SAM-dependent methyltransferase
MNCRFCGTPLSHPFIDLGAAPPSNAYLSAEDLRKPELFFPLSVLVCDSCWLVQTQTDARADDLFRDDYAYFSSTSSTWLNHAADFVEMICPRLGLDQNSFVVEIASNDGYLLKNVVRRNIPCLGIEPTAGTAQAAERLGIPVLRQFFDQTLARRLASDGRQADLIIGNNVYAHVPDIMDFTAGMKTLLKPGGTITLEFPHLLKLIESVQFDTIYHEHYAYLSLYTVNRIFEAVGLTVYDVEELPTHGGSLRIYGCHAANGRVRADAVADLLSKEEAFGLQRLSTYTSFQQKADDVKNRLLLFLLEQKKLGKKIAAYGAAAKGNTLLNYAGVKPDLFPYVCDAAVSKQGKYLPGSRIPILPPDILVEKNPDVILVLPWNLIDEIRRQYAYVFDWGGVFATSVPDIQIWEAVP